MSVVIEIEDVSKQYRLGNIGTGTLTHDVNRWWHKVRGKEDPYLKIGEENDRTKKTENEYVWALRDINFQVNNGEVLGIIGKNGAGKSTLLKILSRTTTPTTGSIKIKGRVASLLEVGTGFHPELTGRENIFLNGAILGMTKAEIKRKFDEIVGFSGVERYIDTPVKRYSSGMYVRLAFAVAAHLDPEILIVDEVLAVGDAEFQKKCLGKMKDVSVKEGRTVLFVSHNMQAVLNLCDSAVLMMNGRIEKTGTPNSLISHYQQQLSHITNKWYSEKSKTYPHFNWVNITLKGKQPNLCLVVNFEIISVFNHQPLFVAFDVLNSMGTPILQAIPIDSTFIKYSTHPQKFTCEIYLKGLVPDTYFVSAWVGEHYTITHDWQREILSFEVIDSPMIGRTIPHYYQNGFLVVDSKIIDY